MVHIKKEDIVPIVHQTQHIENKTDYFYTVIGKHDFIDFDNRPRSNAESSEILAKKTITDNGNYRYYLKVGQHGKLFNPIGLFSEGNNKKFNSKFGKKEWNFKEVNQEIFNMYINFLTTKNTAWLNNAERAMV